MEEGAHEVSAELYVMSDNEPHTMNVGDDGEFACLVCEHFIIYTNETEWGETSGGGGSFMHMHGTEPFHYCHNCGRGILTPAEWAERHPEDQGKTLKEIRRRFI